ncbi:MAG: complex I subunit 5 family protein, partial [Eubacteriales bacterium]
FTGYVFVEICTIASCSLLMVRSSGRSLVAATRYMIFSLIGSGFFLIGIILLYSVTGHLLFPQLYESVQNIWNSGEYKVPLTVSVGLMVSGLAIKSGLFPFHFWMPDTYGTATPAASGILSGVISKGYIFLLIKIIFRVIGFDVFYATSVQNILLVFGICGMIFGSVAAIRAKDINFMIAFSSAAQIGYIYMGLGLGTSWSIIAALFQIVAHALTKPMLFLSAAGLSGASGGKRDFLSLRSSAHRNLCDGAAFLAGSLSMVGIPIFAGFVPKLLFAISSFGHGIKTYFILAALAISTILNVMYFLRTVLTIYTSEEGEKSRKGIFSGAGIHSAVVLIMAAVNIAVGLCSYPLFSLFERGLEIFINIR